MLGKKFYVKVEMTHFEKHYWSVVLSSLLLSLYIINHTIENFKNSTLSWGAILCSCPSIYTGVLRGHEYLVILFGLLLSV